MQRFYPSRRTCERRRKRVWQIGLFAVKALLPGFLFFVVFSASGDDVSGQPHKLFEWRPFLAPFHAVVLHLPIGFILVAVILELFQWRCPSQELQRATNLIIWLGLFAGVVSAGLGLLRAQGGGYEARAVELHRNFGLSIPIFTLAALAFQKLARRDPSGRIWSASYRITLASTLALVVVAGHYGGNLTHGSKYLVENAPEFVRELMDDPPPASEAAAAAQDEQQRNYLQKVRPIFLEKCYSCHASEKQKGEYRLDQPERALKGGESGKLAIKPGDPFESQLVRRILLPPEHDDVMPPSGKQPLSSEEIMVIIDWIRSGAAMPAAAPGPSPVKSATEIPKPGN